MPTSTVHKITICTQQICLVSENSEWIYHLGFRCSACEPLLTRALWSISNFPQSSVCFLSQGSPTHCKNNKLIKRKQDYNDCTTPSPVPMPCNYLSACEKWSRKALPIKSNLTISFQASFFLFFSFFGQHTQTCSSVSNSIPPSQHL